MRTYTLLGYEPLNLPNAIMLDGVWYYERKDGWYPYSVAACDLPDGTVDFKIHWKWRKLTI